MTSNVVPLVANIYSYRGDADDCFIKLEIYDVEEPCCFRILRSDLEHFCRKELNPAAGLTEDQG